MLCTDGRRSYLVAEGILCSMFYNIDISQASLVESLLQKYNSVQTCFAPVMMYRGKLTIQVHQFI